MKKLYSFLIVTLLCYQASIAQQKKTKEPADIKFEKMEHDFGNIVIDKHVNIDFIFTNIGTSPIVISYCTSSSGNIVSTFAPTPTMPGKKEKIAVKFYPTKLGLFYKTITVAYTTAADAYIITLAIKGTVVEAK